MDKINQFIASLFKMSITELIMFFVVLLVLFLVLAHPIKSILLFVIIWLLSLPFRNFIKKVIAKWKS